MMEKSAFKIFILLWLKVIIEISQEKKGFSSRVNQTLVPVISNLQAHTSSVYQLDYEDNI